MAAPALPLDLPERSIEDIVAERIRVAFGDESFVLPVRSIDSNERFVASMEAEISGVLAAVNAAEDDVSAIFGKLAPLAGRLLAFVSDYDETGVLPPLADLRKIARPLQAIAAALEVWRAVNPLADAGLAAVRLGTAATPSAAPTSLPPRRGAGPRGGSGPNSPTSSSSSISTPPATDSPVPLNRASRRSARGRSSPTTPRPIAAGAPQPTTVTADHPASRVTHSRRPS